MTLVSAEEKLEFIKNELSQFRKIKRECKYTYKNWFKQAHREMETFDTGSLSKMGQSAGSINSMTGLWQSPKFIELNNNHYTPHYGKLYITCLHIMYRKLQNRNKSTHTKEDDKSYLKTIQYINMWIEERITDTKNKKNV